MSEPQREAGAPGAPREVVVPEPTGRLRVALPIAGVIWTLLMIAIPLRYYLGGDAYDERFAWRMFSAVRVQHCAVRVTEERAGGARAVPLMDVLPAPWAALLERNRPAVVEGFLRARCDAHDDTREVRFRSECSDASGDPLPPIERSIECESGRIVDAASPPGAAAGEGS